MCLRWIQPVDVENVRAVAPSEALLSRVASAEHLIIAPGGIPARCPGFG
jgi:hypothetical protein